MLEINYSSPEPLYSQIRMQVISMLEAGELQPGDSLPSIRNLSRQLAIAANTVARAYQELESEGVLVTGGRRGTFIRTDYGGGSEGNELLRRGIDKLLEAGAEPAETVDRVIQCLRQSRIADNIIEQGLRKQLENREEI